mgnify:CR=1 FL=1
MSRSHGIPANGDLGTKRFTAGHLWTASDILPLSRVLNAVPHDYSQLIANADMWKCQILTATQLTSDRKDQPTNHTVPTVHSYSSSRRVRIQSCEASTGRLPQPEIHLVSSTTSQLAPPAIDHAISARGRLPRAVRTLRTFHYHQPLHSNRRDREYLRVPHSDPRVRKNLRGASFSIIKSSLITDYQS